MKRPGWIERKVWFSPIFRWHLFRARRDIRRAPKMLTRDGHCPDCGSKLVFAQRVERFSTVRTAFCTRCEWSL